MFRIPRIRIRRKKKDQDDSNAVPAARPEQTSNRGPFRYPGSLDLRNWHVRVKWVGFGIVNNTLPAQPVAISMPGGVPTSPPIRVLQTFNLPKIRVRLSWVGAERWTNVKILAWSLLFVLLTIFTFTRLAYMDKDNPVFAVQRSGHTQPVITEFTLDGEPVKITYSRLDMGQVKDLFDHDTVTLIRGLEANPFVLDFEFPTPRPITGLVMDFGGMDFDLRVKVYGAEDNQPVLYENEYRNQPPEPHVDLSFVSGPALVTRIYIEIEQYSPPDEPHIHVREVLFKK
jgi:hypothetical protein